MKSHLRPMTLGEILDRTFSLYRSRFRLFVGISSLAALGTLALLVLGLLLDAFLSQTTLAGSTKAFVMGVGSAISLQTWHSLCLFVAWPVILFATSQELFGNRAAFRPSIAHCARRWRSWLAMSASLWAIWNGIPVLIQAIPIFALARLNAMRAFASGTESIATWPRSLFYLWLGWIISLAVSAALWMCVPVWTLEEAGLGALPARVRALVRKAYGRIGTAWCVTALISWVLMISASFFILVVFRMMLAITHHSGPYPLFRAAILLPDFAASILASPLFPIALSLIYYDQRIRQEGYDIEMMMDAAGMNAAAAVEPAVPSADESGEQPA